MRKGRILTGVLMGSALGVLLTVGNASAALCAVEFGFVLCDTSTVPEPSTLVLLTAGLGGLAWWLRKQR